MSLKVDFDRCWVIWLWSGSLMCLQIIPFELVLHTLSVYMYSQAVECSRLDVLQTATALYLLTLGQCWMIFFAFLCVPNTRETQPLQIFTSPYQIFQISPVCFRMNPIKPFTMLRHSNQQWR